MGYCKKCGYELPDHARFCSKCGTAEPLGNLSVEPSEPRDNNTTEAAVEKQTLPANTEGNKPSTAEGFVKYVTEKFMPLYVILGVTAFVLSQFSTLFMFLSFALGVVIGVFAMIVAIAFCVVGSVKYFGGHKADDKRTNSEIICFAVGIIGAVFIIVSTSVLLKYGSDLWNTMEMLSSIAGG